MDQDSSSSTPLRRSLRKFRANPLAMSGLVFIVALILISLIGPFIRPDKTVNANGQNLVISRQQPGFECMVFLEPLTGTSGEISSWQAWINGGYPPKYREIAIDSYQWEGDQLLLKTYGTGESIQIDCTHFY